MIASILMKRLAHCSCYGTVIDWTVIINPAATKYVDNFQSHLRFDAAATAKELEKLNKYDDLTRELHEGKFYHLPLKLLWLEELLLHPEEIVDRSWTWDPI